MRLKLEQRIDAPPGRVFEVFSDIAHAAERIGGITKIEPVGDQPVGVGFRWRETRVMFGKEHTEELWITAFDPPRSYTVESDSCGAHFVTVFRVTPEGSGSLVEMDMNTTANTVMAKLMSPLGALMKGTMVKLMKKDLDDLKRAAEATPG